MHIAQRSHRIETELRETYLLVEMACVLLNVTDTAAVRGLFERERPQVVFHAAAYKHVPLLEQQIRPAVRNNVLGTHVIAQATNDFECEEFVLISTDKAVHPINSMVPPSERPKSSIRRSSRIPKPASRRCALVMCWTRRAAWRPCSDARSSAVDQ